jgi:hypothetical protein
MTFRIFKDCQKIVSRKQTKKMESTLEVGSIEESNNGTIGRPFLQNTKAAQTASGFLFIYSESLFSFYIF